MNQAEFVCAQVVLPVRDMPAARAWYQQALGLETVYVNSDPDDDPDGNYAILRRDQTEVHLILDESPREHPWSTAGTGYLYLVVSSLESVLERVQTSGVPLARPLRGQDWGARGFHLIDPSGNLILVAESVG